MDTLILAFLLANYY